jgi:hypothetical protein
MVFCYSHSNITYHRARLKQNSNRSRGKCRHGMLVHAWSSGATPAARSCSCGGSMGLLCELGSSLKRGVAPRSGAGAAAGAGRRRTLGHWEQRPRIELGLARVGFHSTSWGCRRSGVGMSWTRWPRPYSVHSCFPTYSLMFTVRSRFVQGLCQTLEI